MATKHKMITTILLKIYDLIDLIAYQLTMVKHRPKLFWDNLWVRKNEFHSSNFLNYKAYVDMNEKDRVKYHLKLLKRRKTAHEKDIENNDELFI